MKILSVSGEVVVSVDGVDIEQIVIECPKVVEGFPVSLQAMVAALYSQEVRGLQKQLIASNSTLEYLSSEFVRPDTWTVKFKIIVYRPREESLDTAGAA